VESCTYPQNRRFKVFEEKRTDVNIAIQMLDDAYQDACDLSVLVSGDSDLVPGVNRLKNRFPAKKVVVYVPSRDAVRGAAVELRASADEHRNLPLSILPHAQFPRQIPDGAGGLITKPSTW
jgi:6-hydroxy-3-succinoylpyridine 3-monooxygenase